MNHFPVPRANQARCTAGPRHTGGVRARSHQRGTVLLLSLVILSVLLVSSVALIRSFDTSLFTAGNLAFKRDLVHQGERIVPVIFQRFDNPAQLGTDILRNAHQQGMNYSASMLESNVQGVPVVLLNDGLFTTVATTANDLSFPDQGVLIRYVIDRMCTGAGEVSAERCVIGGDVHSLGHTGQDVTRGLGLGGGVAGGGGLPVVYRITARVTGPRNTVTFLQTNFSL